MISSKKIKDLHPALQRGVYELIKRSEEKKYKIAISSTYRDIEYQNELYKEGRSKPGHIITNSKGGQSMHNYRLAFDIYQNIPKKEYSNDSFFESIGKIWIRMGGEWGGSWSGFVDLPHFQFTNNLDIKQLQNGIILKNDTKMPWENTLNPNINIKSTVSNYIVTNVQTYLNIRSEASKNSSIIGHLKNNDIIKVYELNKEFAKTDKGWISLNYLKKI